MRKILLAMSGAEKGWTRWNELGIFRDYTREVDRLFESAKPWGLECMRIDDNYILNLPYYEQHKDIFERVSFGFSFKAIGYYEIFKQIDYGDIVMFCDSNHVVSENPGIFYDIANKHDCFIHDHIYVQYLNRYYTHRDTFVNMNCDEEKYWDSFQMQFNISAFKKTPKTVDFIEELFNDFLTFKIMFGEGKYPDFEGFRFHRHDQSVLSILREKYGFPYLNRTENLWGETIIPEVDAINLENPIDNSYRREQDSFDNI